MSMIRIILILILITGCKTLGNINQEQLLTKGLIWKKEKGMLNNHKVNDSIYDLYKVGDKIETYKLYGLTRKEIFN